jgi:hypothetical protein
VPAKSPRKRQKGGQSSAERQSSTTPGAVDGVVSCLEEARKLAANELECISRIEARLRIIAEDLGRGSRQEAGPIPREANPDVEAAEKRNSALETELEKQTKILEVKETEILALRAETDVLRLAAPEGRLKKLEEMVVEGEASARLREQALREEITDLQRKMEEKDKILAAYGDEVTELRAKAASTVAREPIVLDEEAALGPKETEGSALEDEPSGKRVGRRDRESGSGRSSSRRSEGPERSSTTGPEVEIRPGKTNEEKTDTPGEGLRLRALLGPLRKKS